MPEAVIHVLVKQPVHWYSLLYDPDHFAQRRRERGQVFNRQSAPSNVIQANATRSDGRIYRDASD